MEGRKLFITSKAVNCAFVVVDGKSWQLLTLTPALTGRRWDMHNSGKIHEGFGNIIKTLVNVNKFDAVTL